ncbi:MAG: hypothetical protein AUK63_2030 [bacterium P3]|nr:MAG: hypothetical protein AUK64_1993 [bacterium P201]KWW28154.1 MAG: hypothetical protein AUK63_2030 [bacterium P3]KWW33402.1 MAG: hypothetical protein F083_2522 [bacterium F083]
MENNNTTEKTQVYNLIILDKSGSMGSIANAAIAGFNETVGGIRSAQERFKDTQEHFVSLMIFCNCEKTMLYDMVPVDKVKELTSREYRPCCGTPLYDAMGLSINALYNAIKDKDNATAVVTVITDGYENASREYSGQAIKALVERMKDEEGWNFAYIGTNQDVEATSASLSIDNHMAFIDDDEGMRGAWEKERKAKISMFSRFSMSSETIASMSPIERKAYWSKMHRSSRNYHEIGEFQNRVTPNHIKSLKDGEIFVFGSNLAGAHAGGAARVAVEKFGAVMGQGVGLQGQSYAIPTMQGGVDTILPYVEEFIRFADMHPELTFLVTRIGCGIAGFTPAEIAPLFAGAINVPNIHLPMDFWTELV